MYTHAHNQSNIQVETPTLHRHDQIHKKLSKETLGFNFPYLSQFILPTFESYYVQWEAQLMIRQLSQGSPVLHFYIALKSNQLKDTKRLD